MLYSAKGFNYQDLKRRPNQINLTITTIDLHKFMKHHH